MKTTFIRHTETCNFPRTGVNLLNKMTEANKAWLLFEEPAQIQSEMYRSLVEYRASSVEAIDMNMPEWMIPFVIDIDVDGNIPEAERRMELYKQFFVSKGFILGKDFTVHFSGSKGFHIIFPSSVYMQSDKTGKSTLQDEFNTQKEAVFAISAELGMADKKDVDSTIYSIDRLFRTAGSVNAKSDKLCCVVDGAAFTQEPVFNPKLRELIKEYSNLYKNPKVEVPAVVAKVKQATKAIKPSNSGSKCSVIEYLIANPEALSPLEAGKGSGHKYIFQLLSMLFQYPAGERDSKYNELVSALNSAKVDPVHICSLANLEETGKVPSCGSMVEYCKLAGINHSDLCRGCQIRQAHLKSVKNDMAMLDFESLKTYDDFKTFMANYYYKMPVELPNSVIRAEIVKRMLDEYNFQASGNLLLAKTDIPQLKRVIKSGKQYIKTLYSSDYKDFFTEKAADVIAKELTTKSFEDDIWLSITKKINSQRAILLSDNRVMDSQLRIREIAEDDLFINRISSTYTNDCPLSDEYKNKIDKAIAEYRNEYIYNIMGLVMSSIIPGQDRQMFLSLVGSALDEFGIEQNAGFGKTAFMYLMTALIGEQNTISTKIEEFDKRFIDSSFPSLMLIYIDEVNNKAQAHDAMNAMKMFVNQGSRIQIEAKGANERVSYVNNSGIVIATNSPSTFLDKSDQGSRRRFQPCVFTHNFAAVTPSAEQREASENFVFVKNLLETSQDARNYLFTKIINFMRECMAKGDSLVPESFMLKKEDLLTNHRDDVAFAVFDEYLGFDYNRPIGDRLTTIQIRNKLIQLGVKSIPDSPVHFGRTLMKYIKKHNGEDFRDTVHKQSVYRCFIVEDFGRAKKVAINLPTAVEMLEKQRGNKAEGNIVNIATAQPSTFKSTYGTNNPDPFDIVFGEQSSAPLA